jgi:hypothetical protein
MVYDRKDDLAVKSFPARNSENYDKLQNIQCLKFFSELGRILKMNSIHSEFMSRMKVS